MAKSILSGPRRNPVGVLLTHVPFLFFWMWLISKTLDEAQLTHRGSEFSAADDPAGFYFYVAMFIAIALLAGFRAIYALLVFVGLEPMEDEE